MPTLRLLWLGLALLVLIGSLATWDGQPNCDCDVLLLYGMLALGFPTSILAAGAIALAYQLSYQWSATVVATSLAEMSLTWAWLAAAGYLQWFVLLPWAIRRIRGGRHRAA